MVSRRVARVGLLVGLLGIGRGELDARPLRVVTTVAPLSDLVQQVGGRLIELRGLIPEGADAHTYDPPPTSIRWITEADVIILNGFSLEGSIEKLVKANQNPSATVLRMGDRILTHDERIFDAHFPKAKGVPNPHLWLDVAYAMRYVELVGGTFRVMDPTQDAVYAAQTERYLQRLRALDTAIAQAVATIPPSQRKVFTYHDAWGYFARRYGLQMVGALQPTHLAEPSPQEVVTLIKSLRRAQVQVIFGSEVFPSKMLQQIAQEAGVRWIKTLRDDTLPGAPGEPRHSYLGMMLENVETIVAALGGDPAPLKGKDLTDAASH